MKDGIVEELMIVELGELADTVISGQVISRIEAKDLNQQIGEAQVLTLKAINCGVIDDKENTKIPVVKEADFSKISRKNDIIMKMNRPYDSVFIEQDYEGYVIPSFCCKISRIKTELADPYFLVGFLNSDFAKDYLLASNGASAASLLKIADIKKLPVPLPDLEEQHAIGQVFKACCERRIILRNLMDHETALAESIVLDAVREVMRYEKHSFQ